MMRSLKGLWHAGWKMTVFLVIALLVGAAAVYESMKEDPVDVRVTSAKYQDLATSITTNGKVMLLNDFQARAASPGMIENVYVHVGEKVSPGQLLLKMKDPFADSRMASAQAILEGAKSIDENTQRGGTQEERSMFKGDLVHARMVEAEAVKHLAMLKELEKRGAASGGEITAAEQAVQDAQNALNTLTERTTERFSPGDIHTARARVRDAQANVESARSVLANVNIRSSIAGTVYSIPVAAYDFVNMGADLLRVADLDAMEVRAYFDEPEIGHLKAGQAVDILWDAKPDRVWHGHVRQVPLTVFPMGTRTVGQCLIALDAKDELLPNTDVTITVSVARQAHTLTIPRQALSTEGDRHFVYRVVHNRLERTEVNVGLINLKVAQILSGISPADVVALDAINNRELGTYKVRVVERVP